MNVLYIRNPEDGITTYDQIKVYRSDSKNGTYLVINTINIDSSTIDENNSGYTKVTDNTGTSDHWYKVSYYNSVSLVESDLSTEFQGGTTELDTKIRVRMKDTNVNKYFFTQDELTQARDNAIKSLFPHTWIDTVYEVAITESNKKTITLPQYVSRMDKIKVYDSSGDLIANNFLGFYKVGNKLYANDEFPVGDTFRFIITKAYKIPAECPEEFDPYLIDVAQIELLKILEMDRARYYKYTTSIRPEAGNIPSLNRMIERLEGSTRVKLNSMRRVREVTEINLVE